MYYTNTVKRVQIIVLKILWTVVRHFFLTWAVLLAPCRRRIDSHTVRACTLFCLVIMETAMHVKRLSKQRNLKIRLEVDRSTTIILKFGIWLWWCPELRLVALWQRSGVERYPPCCAPAHVRTRSAPWPDDSHFQWASRRMKNRKHSRATRSNSKRRILPRPQICAQYSACTRTKRPINAIRHADWAHVRGRSVRLTRARFVISSTWTDSVLARSSALTSLLFRALLCKLAERVSSFVYRQMSWSE